MTFLRKVFNKRPCRSHQTLHSFHPLGDQLKLVENLVNQILLESRDYVFMITVWDVPQKMLRRWSFFMDHDVQRKIQMLLCIMYVSTSFVMNHLFKNIRWHHCFQIPRFASLSMTQFCKLESFLEENGFISINEFS